MYFHIFACISLGWLHRNGISGPKDKCVSNFARYWQNSDKSLSVAVSPLSQQAIVSTFWIFANLIGEK